MSNSEDKVILTKKLMTICPICGMQIYGKDLDILTLEKIKYSIDHWPVSYIHCHSHKNFPLHAITIYIDSNFSVRGEEVSNYVKIQK